MEDSSYIVHLTACDEAPPWKHFRTRVDAVDNARKLVQEGAAEAANIYVVLGTSNAAAAITLWREGKADPVQICTRQASDAQVDEFNRQTMETAQKSGSLALLKRLDLIPRDTPDPPKLRRI